MRAPAGARREMMLGLLALEMAGVTTELLFLQHFEDPWQMAPLAIIAVALAAISWHIIDRGAASIRVLQVTMALAILSAAFGLVFHYSANAEFQLDIDPSLGGAALLFKVLRAKAPPALAPGIMAHIGLLGLAYTYRHPALRSRSG